MSAVATRYTLDFVQRSLPDGARAILEVGCGRGELAAALGEAGYAVLALDCSEDAVAAAKGLGVHAQVGNWPTDVDERYDAVLFTRSIHHIHDLEGAVRAAIAALHPRGRMIVEDFRAEGGSPRSSSWFTGLVKLLHSAGAFRGDFDLEQMLAKTETVDHEHPLHSSTAIAKALGRFGAIEAEDAPYYFRYFEDAFRSDEALALVLEHERSLIAADTIDALGKRFVLSP